jgi:hypothetical protein
MCKDFNKGKCTNTGTSQCPKHPNRYHQCSKCGSSQHPAKDCKPTGKGAGKGAAKAAATKKDWKNSKWDQKGKNWKK